MTIRSQKNGQDSITATHIKRSITTGPPSETTAIESDFYFKSKHGIRPPPYVINCEIKDQKGEKLMNEKIQIKFVKKEEILIYKN